jgi:hypothetical protein
MGYGKPVLFQPISLLTAPLNDSDNLALKMVYSLQQEVADTMKTERSAQQHIGISEIGNDCTKCLARKLSGLYEKPFDPSWKAQVGTFIHAGLEEHFQDQFGEEYLLFHPSVDDAIPGMKATARDDAPIYHMERRVNIIKHKTLDLGGSCDLFIQGATYGLVCDWKTHGPAKLKKTAAAQIGNTYTVQMHTYGLGYELLGFLVTHVVLYALPRDGELNEAKPVLMRYDRDIAIQALARVTTLIDAAEIIGWPKLIELQDKASPCWDCQDYEALEADGFLTDITA